MLDDLCRNNISENDQVNWSEFIDRFKLLYEEQIVENFDSLKTSSFDAVFFYDSNRLLIAYLNYNFDPKKDEEDIDPFYDYSYTNYSNPKTIRDFLAMINSDFGAVKFLCYDQLAMEEGTGAKFFDAKGNEITPFQKALSIDSGFVSMSLDGMILTITDRADLNRKLYKTQ